MGKSRIEAIIPICMVENEPSRIWNPPDSCWLLWLMINHKPSFSILKQLLINYINHLLFLVVTSLLLLVCFAYYCWLMFPYAWSHLSHQAAYHSRVSKLLRGWCPRYPEPRPWHGAPHRPCSTVNSFSKDWTAWVELSPGSFLQRGKHSEFMRSLALSGLFGSIVDEMARTSWWWWR